MRPLRFRIADRWATERNVVSLMPNTWDDYNYQTLYEVTFHGRGGEQHPIGAVKIGQYELESAPRGSKPRPGVGRPALPSTFARLDNNLHFSLGQDASYYEAINRLDQAYQDFRVDYLTAMNDMAFDSETMNRALPQEVTTTSLLRTLSLRSVKDQFVRLAGGGDAVVGYELTFPIRDEPGAQELVCMVEPNARPPENIRILIGRNGAGKTTMLRDIARILAAGSKHPDVEEQIQSQRDQLANLVSVAFSAFDPFPPIQNRRGLDGLTYHYVGLKTLDLNAGPEEELLDSGNNDERQVEPDLTSQDFADGNDPADVNRAPRWRPMTVPELDTQTVKSVHYCIGIDARRTRLLNALTLLDADPNFASFGIRDMVEEAGPNDDIRGRLHPIVENLSSGHKISLLTVSRLVETVAEKTLVLVDEPESHLHPPLLSALVRALSDLLADRNGLAIVATHSPVVLQEVPKSCVRIVENTLGDVKLRELQLETFGENVGTLTGEVFGLEVTSTGYHAMIQEAANERDTYEAALEVFDGQLGAEGRAILRSMIAAKPAPRGRDVGR